MNKPLTVKTQLLLLSSIFMAMLIGIGGLGAYKVKAASDSMKSIYEDRVVPLKQLKIVADMYAINIVDTAHKIRDGAMTSEQGITAINEARKNVKAQWNAYTATSLVAREQTLITKIRPLMLAADASVDQMEKIVRAKDQAALTAYAAHDMYPVLDLLQAVIADLIQVQLDESQSAYEASVASFKDTLETVFGTVLGALVLGGLFATKITRGLTQALGAEPSEVKRVAEAVAAGDLYYDIALRNGDTSSVMAAMKAMSMTLQQTVSTVREGAESVATASAQIYQGNYDLSSRTEQQASALEETSASMEEIQTTVKHNADTANTANQMAVGANAAATRGGRVVNEVVGTMKQIDEASRQISDIIGVIDGIAFQTNILALNAAVEAARAGEQGRGFAIVATEVRNLAGRSADAAKQIKTLIAANAERVEAGALQAEQAGEAMGEIVQSIQRVTDLMSEISSASKEQSIGVAHVTEAVTQMDQVTQQNAALVEESTAAAQSLKNQAEQLVSAVAVFKLRKTKNSESSPSAPLSMNAGVERRGPNRATNVTRVAFGKAMTGSNQSGVKYKTLSPMAV